MDIVGCEWHDGEIAYYTAAEDVPYCPECGRMIAVKECGACHDTFMDWDYRSFDDIVAGPGVTRQGDFCCIYCLYFIEAELEQQEMEDAEELDFGLYDDLP